MAKQRQYDKLAMLGNSLTGGVWASRADNTFLAQFQNKLKEAGYANLMSIPKFPGGKGGGWGNVFAHWEVAVKEAYPDIILLQGAFEQDGTNTVTSLNANLPADSDTVSFNVTPPDSQIYLLVDEMTGDKEWVNVTRTDGARTWRGLFGTNPKNWAAGTKVVANPNKSLFVAPKMTWQEAHASRARLDAIARHVISATMGYKPIVLICDVGFAIDPSFTAGIRDYVYGLNMEGYSNVAFVEYTDKNGNRIWNNREAIGASADITGVSANGDSPAQLTVTCNNALGVKNLRAGEYVALHDVSLGAFAFNRIECMIITSVNYTNNTFVVSSANRGKLGSTAITTFGSGDIVCKYSSVGAEIRRNFDTLGTSEGFQDCWARDSHPVDYGYGLLADAAMRAFKKVVI